MVFTGALQALAGIIPLDLEIKEATVKQRIKACLLTKPGGRAEIEIPNIRCIFMFSKVTAHCNSYAAFLICKENSIMFKIHNRYTPQRYII